MKQRQAWILVSWQLKRERLIFNSSCKQASNWASIYSTIGLQLECGRTFSETHVQVSVFLVSNLFLSSARHHPPRRFHSFPLLQEPKLKLLGLPGLPSSGPRTFPQAPLSHAPGSPPLSVPATHNKLCLQSSAHASPSTQAVFFLLFSWLTFFLQHGEQKHAACCHFPMAPMRIFSNDSFLWGQSCASKSIPTKYFDSFYQLIGIGAQNKTGVISGYSSTSCWELFLCPLPHSSRVLGVLRALSTSHNFSYKLKCLDHQELQDSFQLQNVMI